MTKPLPQEFDFALWDDSFTLAAGSLYAQEYGGTVQEHIDRFDRTYNHAFQSNREIRIVATQGAEIAGIQTLFYWPYVRKGSTFRVWQSGNSIIAPQFRGQGLFGRMLAAQNEMLKDRTDIDFLLGFPVSASRGSFLRNGWTALDDLEWRLKVVNPLRAVFKLTPELVSNNLFQHEGSERIADEYPDQFRMVKDPLFQDWRRGIRSGREVLLRICVKGGDVVFRVKIEERHNIPIALIGDISPSSFDLNMLQRAFSKLFAQIRRAGAAAVTVCYNPSANLLVNQAIKTQFPLKLKNKVHVIVKPVSYQHPSIKDSTNWVLHRADVDTW